LTDEEQRAWILKVSEGGFVETVVRRLIED